MNPAASFSEASVSADMSDKTAIISDIHGNFPALQAVLDDISQKGCSKIFVLGDMINGIDPLNCIRLLRGREKTECLKGNAEFYVLTPDLEDFPRINEPMYLELIPLLQWFKSQLSAHDLEWLHGLPDLIVWNGACFVHDSPLDRLSTKDKVIPGIHEKYQELCFHAKGITPDMPEADWESLWRWMEVQSLSHVFCGHTHIPFYRKMGVKLICNVGSVGLPLDGDPRSSWVMLEKKPGGESIITIHRVSYEVDQILNMVDDSPDYPDFKLPADREAYKKTLATGRFWR